MCVGVYVYGYVCVGMCLLRPILPRHHYITHHPHLSQSRRNQRALSPSSSADDVTQPISLRYSNNCTRLDHPDENYTRTRRASSDGRLATPNYDIGAGSSSYNGGGSQSSSLRSSPSVIPLKRNRPPEMTRSCEDYHNYGGSPSGEEDYFRLGSLTSNRSARAVSSAPHLIGGCPVVKVRSRLRSSVNTSTEYETDREEIERKSPVRTSISTYACVRYTEEDILKVTPM